MRHRRLRDDQWDRIKDDLPGRAGPVGVTAADNSHFMDAVLYRYRSGILPKRCFAVPEASDMVRLLTAYMVRTVEKSQRVADCEQCQQTEQPPRSVTSGPPDLAHQRLLSRRLKRGGSLTCWIVWPACVKAINQFGNSKWVRTANSEGSPFSQSPARSSPDDVGPRER
jgi:hypothetical protein